MIRISRSSWHYKLYSLGSDWHVEQENLCRYCRVALAGLFKIVLIVGIMATVIGLAGFCTYRLFIFECTMFSTYQVNTIIGHLVLVGLVSLLVLRRKISLSSTPKQVNLIGAWISAKKQKICPLVEIVDDNTTDIT